MEDMLNSENYPEDIDDIEQDDDDDYCEPSSEDLEMGFNPYMGCCDYDC